jgi:hypothetical protein
MVAPEVHRLIVLNLLSGTVLTNGISQAILQAPQAIRFAVLEPQRVPDKPGKHREGRIRLDDASAVHDGFAEAHERCAQV